MLPAFGEHHGGASRPHGPNSILDDQSVTLLVGSQHRVEFLMLGLALDAGSDMRGAGRTN